MPDWKVLHSTVMLSHLATIRDEEISEVETAILSRGRELVAATDHNSADEKDDLADALYTLYALKHSVIYARIGRAFPNNERQPVEN
ncbi:MAG TPA: hypothetical protein VMU05_18445 [Dongiaceae bacterium]|nr:hypothetical protein [Dongiaceae bacterium]